MQRLLKRLGVIGQLGISRHDDLVDQIPKHLSEISLLSLREFGTTDVSAISRSMNIGQEKKEQLLVNCNMAMQMLDDKGLSPYRTFDSIGKLAELLIKSKGDAFCPRPFIGR